MKTESSPVTPHHGHLPRFVARIEEKSRCGAAAPVLVVALGDSVTQGIAGVVELLHDQVCHAQLQKQIQRGFPLNVFNTIRGWPATNRYQRAQCASAFSGPASCLMKNRRPGMVGM